MRIGIVVGKVTLNRSHPALEGATLRLAVPLSLAEVEKGTKPTGEEIVVYDELGAGEGSMIAISESREAAQPFYPNAKPIDAYNAAILDGVEIQDSINTENR